ncbi:MAG: hypothetical protein ACTSXW_04690 [Candidatus Baldrarchaeia archaeon]
MTGLKFRLAKWSKYGEYEKFALFVLIVLIILNSPLIFYAIYNDPVIFVPMAFICFSELVLIYFYTFNIVRRNFKPLLDHEILKLAEKLRRKPKRHEVMKSLGIGAKDAEEGLRAVSSALAEMFGKAPEMIEKERVRKTLMKKTLECGGILNLPKAYAEIENVTWEDVVKAIEVWLKGDRPILECIVDHLYVLADRFSNQQLEILKLAHDKNGKITIDEIALRLRYSINQVQKLLKSFEDLEIAYPVVEKGVKYWYFPALWKINEGKSG